MLPIPLWLLPAYLSASVASRPVPELGAFTRHEPRLAACVCDVRLGNSDLYGIGIRIGIYLQWASALLANSFYFEEVYTQLATNTIFLVALCIATAVLAIQDSLLQAEYSVVIRLAFGFTLTILTVGGRRITSGPERRYFALLYDLETVPSWTSLWLRRILCVIIYSFSTWYWTSVAAADGDPEGTCCPTYHFFASRQTSTLAFRSFEAFVSIFLLSCHLSGILWDLVGGAIFIRTLRSRRKAAEGQVGNATGIWAGLNDEKGFVAGYARLVDPELFHLDRIFDTILGLDPTRPPTALTQLAYYIVHATLMGPQNSQYLDRPYYRGWTPLLESILTIIYTSGDFVPWMNAAYAAWAIVGIELTIHWNHITGVDTIASTGQLIPLVIGVFSLFKTVLGLHFYLVKNGLQYRIFQLRIKGGRGFREPIRHQHRDENAMFVYKTRDDWLALKANNYLAEAPLTSRHSIADIPQMIRQVRHDIWTDDQIQRTRAWKRQHVLRPWEAHQETVKLTSPNGTQHDFVNNWRQLTSCDNITTYERKRRWSTGYVTTIRTPVPDLVAAEEATQPGVPLGTWAYPSPDGNVIQFWDRRYLKRSLSSPDLRYKPRPEDALLPREILARRSSYQQHGHFSEGFKQSGKSFVGHLAPLSLVLLGPLRRIAFAGDWPDGKIDDLWTHSRENNTVNEVMNFDDDDSVSDSSYSSEDFASTHPRRHSWAFASPAEAVPRRRFAPRRLFHPPLPM